MNWTLIRLEHWKATYVSKALLPQLLQDYEARGYDPKVPPLFQKDVDEAGIDYPGMIMTTRTWVDISLEPGFSLGFPTMDAEDFLDDMKDLQMRRFGDGTPYYKLHGWLQCIVLTPAQLDLAIAYLRDNLKVIRENAQRENDIFTGAIKATNEAAGRTVIVRPEVEKNDPIPKGTPLSGMPSREKN